MIRNGRIDCESEGKCCIQLARQEGWYEDDEIIGPHGSALGLGAGFLGHFEKAHAFPLGGVGAQKRAHGVPRRVDQRGDERRRVFHLPSHSGAARSTIRVPTGAIAKRVSAAERAMTTVPEGTLWAPMAPRTIWSTVEILTNDVNVMKTNGKSETSASATTSASGRLSSVSTWLCMAGDIARRLGGPSIAWLAPRHLGQNLGETRSGPAWPYRGQGVGIELAESGKSPSDAPTT